MSSPFEAAIAQVDKVIADVMMSKWQIGGEEYLAVLDESPRLMEALITRDDPRVNGTERTLTLFKSSGYKPKLNHIAEQGSKRYMVKSFGFQDDLIVLQVE